MHKESEIIGEACCSEFQDFLFIFIHYLFIYFEVLFKNSQLPSIKDSKMSEGQ